MITTIHGEEVKMPRMLHEFTYPELADVKEPVIDWTGIIWAGKDRKGLNAPNPTDLFKAWQKDVQRASGRPGFVAQHVMDYFQAVKFFSKPPKKQEAEELARDVLSKYPRTEQVAKEVIAAAKATTPRFTWSPSKVMQFDTCPFQFAAQYYYKTLPYQETAATIWGTRVHKAAEDYMNGLDVTDPEAFKVVEKWVKILGKIEGERFVEYKMGVDSALKPCDYTTAEGRMILDFGIKRDDELIMIDWKGLALDTPLPTPNGWTTMGQIRVGDEVFGADGMPCKVVGKSQIKNLPCYRLTFCDGEEVVCDEEHLWEAEVRRLSKSEIKVLPVTSIPNLLSEKYTHIRVRLASSLTATHINSGLPMYTLGCWIGDGKHTDGSITKQDITMFDSIEREGMEVLSPQKTVEGKTPCRTVRGLRTVLRNEGLLGNKHIPARWLRYSYEDRLSLLQGLMDSDGYWNHVRKQCVFVTVKEDMAKRVHELLCTLGQRPKIHYVKKHGFGKTFMAWDIAFSPISIIPFRCGRRIEQLGNGATRARNFRYIKKVEQIESVPTQCISVDSEDSMYLCGRGMIPTHNTGKQKDDETQLKIYALVMAILHPDVTKFTYKYVWLKDDAATGGVLERKDLLPIAKDLMSRIGRMKEAWNNEVWVKKKNGLCRRYCQCVECPHCGGGR